jgi:beta-lactamase class A
VKSQPLSIFSLALGAFLGGATIFALLDLKYGPRVRVPLAAEQASAEGLHTPSLQPAPACKYIIQRVTGFEFVHPLLAAEPECEAPRFADLRNTITEVVENLKNDSALTSASVYVRSFALGEWLSFNEAEHYDPASMLKVPLLLSALTLAEKDPELMDRPFNCLSSPAKGVSFDSHHAIPGMSYTVRQLLEFMVKYSDNNATATILHMIAPQDFMNTFIKVGLAAPKMSSTNYAMTARDYSMFMKALYNSALLSPERSEYALALMTGSDFKQGLLAGLPDSVQVSHKFGEAGNGVESQLHETGIIYLDKGPYLVTVMTRGPKMEQLPSAVAAISKVVYECMSHH